MNIHKLTAIWLYLLTMLCFLVSHPVNATNNTSADKIKVQACAATSHKADCHLACQMTIKRHQQ